jgi:hypothetical protein
LSCRCLAALPTLGPSLPAASFAILLCPCAPWAGSPPRLAPRGPLRHSTGPYRAGPITLAPLELVRVGHSSFAADISDISVRVSCFNFNSTLPTSFLPLLPIIHFLPRKMGESFAFFVPFAYLPFKMYLSVEHLDCMMSVYFSHVFLAQ